MALVLLLKDGTDSSQGNAQTISNINACQLVVNILKTTLGPRGSDKLLKDTVTNDGATVLKLLDIEHPAAKTLVDIAKSQDAETGDGTTSVVLLAGEFLKQAKELLETGLAPQSIITAYRQGLALILEQLDELKYSVGDKDGDLTTEKLLMNVATTTLNSKLLASSGQFFARMAVDAVMKLEEEDASLIGVKKVMGGSMEDSFWVDGVAFKKTFSYAGFEQQPKSFENPKILCLNIELELKAEKDNAEIRLADPTQYQSIVDAEWDIIYGKLKACVDCGAQIILSKLAIGDLGTQYFADRGIFCAGRVTEEDMRRVCKATGAQVLSTVTKVPPECLGTCATFNERQVGAERYNLFLGCPQSKTATIVLRGGAEQFVEEAERSLHDAICAVRRTKKTQAILAGGGAIEMELSKFLRLHSRNIHGRSQLILNNYAKALEIIPQQIANNAGYDSTEILNKLRFYHHKQGKRNYGVDIEKGDVCDTFEKFIWEPLAVKRNALIAATEAATLIISIDQTITNPKSEQPGDDTPVGGRPRR